MSSEGKNIKAAAQESRLAVIYQLVGGRWRALPRSQLTLKIRQTETALPLPILLDQTTNRPFLLKNWNTKMLSRLTTAKLRFAD